MIYTDTQFNLMRQAEPHFESVKKEYIRNAPKWLTEQIIDVYEAATNKRILNKDLGCSICVMNIYKIIAKTYYSDLAERQKLQEELKSEEPEVKEVPKEELKSEEPEVVEVPKEESKSEEPEVVEVPKEIKKSRSKKK